MKCPNCNTTMSEVKGESHYGVAIILDQCPECGGLWIDDDEIYRTKLGTARKIEKINIKKLKQNFNIKKDILFCPKDKVELKPFYDINFPKSIQVDKCPICGGFWFNRGQFVTFQDNLKIKREPKKITVKKETNVELEKRLDKLLATGSKKNLETLGDLGAFLSSPIDPLTGKIIKKNRFNDNKNGEDKFAKFSAIFYIVYCLLRLLLKI